VRRGVSSSGSGSSVVEVVTDGVALGIDRVEMRLQL